jgi:hypothetical protein
MKHINKPMFFIMLSPFYLLFLISLVGMSVGSVAWSNVVYSSILIVVAAWSFSRYHIAFHVLGLLIFSLMGLGLIQTTLQNPVRTGPWKFNIYTGAALIIFGALAFIYDVINLVKKKYRK